MFDKSGRKWYYIQALNDWRRWGGIAQLEEHLLCKQGVIGSNPIISTKYIGLYLSRLEHHPDKVGVGGSSPLNPTNK